jgi:hypothetical protein
MVVSFTQFTDSSIHQFQDYTIKHLNLRTKYQETSNQVPSQQASSQLPKAILQNKWY